MSSDLLFNSSSGLELIIISFSVVQRSHLSVNHVLVSLASPFSIDYYIYIIIIRYYYSHNFILNFSYYISIQYNS